MKTTNPKSHFHRHTMCSPFRRCYLRSKFLKYAHPWWKLIKFRRLFSFFFLHKPQSLISINKFIPVSHLVPRRRRRTRWLVKGRPISGHEPRNTSLMRVFRTWHDDVRPFNDPVSVLGAGFCPARVVKSHRHASFLNDPLLSASMDR